MPRRTTRRRIGVPDAFRRLPMDEEDLAGLPSFRVIRVSTEAQDYRGGPEGQAHELDLAERRTGTAPTGLELRDASPGWDAGRLEPALAWAAEGRVKVGLVPYFSRFMRDPALAFAFRDAFHARGCVLYFADRRLLSSDPARQGDFGEQAVKAQIDNLDRARSIAGGIAAKFRTHRDPGGHPALGFRRSGGLRPVLEPDPAHIGEARALFELYATGRYSDDTLALEAARRGYLSVGTGRPLSAAGIAELLRNPVYNGYLVRYRGFSDEERVEAPWRRREGEDGDVVDPPVPDDMWDRVQAIRAERSTPGTRGTRDRIYVPRLVCHGCGLALYGHASNASAADDPPGPSVRELDGGRRYAHELPGRGLRVADRGACSRPPSWTRRQSGGSWPPSPGPPRPWTCAASGAWSRSCAASRSTTPSAAWATTTTCVARPH